MRTFLDDKEFGESGNIRIHDGTYQSGETRNEEERIGAVRFEETST